MNLYEEEACSFNHHCNDHFFTIDLFKGCLGKVTFDSPHILSNPSEHRV